MSIPSIIDSGSERVAKATLPFVQTRLGKAFLSLTLVGPLTFLPTIQAAWFDSNIDSLRTLTWPLMVIVNASVYVSVSHKGDWQVRLVMIIWIVMMAAVWLATLVR